jgi:hypothetical protein
MTLIGHFRPGLAEATVSALAGQSAPEGYVSVRVSFGRRIYARGVDPRAARRTFSGRYWWGLQPWDRAKAVAREYLSSLGLTATALLPTTVRAGNTSAWVVVGELAAVRSAAGGAP